jgi:hypothetical protein
MSLKQRVRTYIGNLDNDINEIKKGCQLRINLLEDDNGDLLAEQGKVIFERQNK